MKMSKERMKSKLNTWVKHVNAGDSRFFFEVNAYTGLSKESFIEELKWLFNDPQDAVVKNRNPYRREVFFYPDGSAHRFIRVYSNYGDDIVYNDDGDVVRRVPLENYRKKGLMIASNPWGYSMGLCIWDKLDVLRSDKERASILQKAAAWRKDARIWGILK